ncbi:tRNA-dihydrouridine synthase C [Neisseria gonorrhoeae]|uniref:tRNA-dihydrouridine synthase C n=1 Tax=Neisseria gonorrhoeae TaxID=485 RepID=A0A378VXT3_NEIGO|nr:tRNA-dihydrouridine synthase C [Neisseria gonorrhoeae]
MIDGQTTEPKQKTRIIPAPMRGLVDDVMRDLLTRIGGYDECVSEFVRITHTVHSRSIWLKYVPEIANGNKTFPARPAPSNFWAAMRTIWRQTHWKPSDSARTKSI